MMRREKLSVRVLLLICTLSLLLVAFRLEPGKGKPSLQHIPRPSVCSQLQVLHLLLKPGALEIWNTGSLAVPVNSRFDPQHYPLTIRAGKPLFTAADLDPTSLSTGRDPITGYYSINFGMKGAAIAKITSFSAHNIGSHITITLERIVVSSLVLRYVLTGKGQFQMSPHSLSLLGIKCTGLGEQRRGEKR